MDVSLGLNCNKCAGGRCSRVLDHVGPCLRLVQTYKQNPFTPLNCYRRVYQPQACGKFRTCCRSSHPVSICSTYLDPPSQLLSPLAYPQTPASSIGTKFVTSSFFRHRAAINHLAYTPDGRRLLCAGNNGNVSLWNGTNFENELGPGIQVHEASPIRCMVFSHSGLFLLSCDDMGRVKFSKPTLEVLQVYHAHKEPCRSVSFSPSDFKFTTGSDDSTVRVFDTFRGHEVSMTGHGGDVRWVDWHPTKGVIASCSKDACVKLWDPRVGTCLSTLHGHKNGVFQVKWNLNGHWLLSCSRDQLVKLYDVRTLREVATFAGHGRDVTCVSWHPHHEELFVTGAIDGSLMMWLASRPDAQGIIPAAHDASVWTTAWHPLGHVLASAGADQKCQFWCRKRPGEIWQDFYRHDASGTGSSSTTIVAAASLGKVFGDNTVAKLGSGIPSMSIPGPPGLGVAACRPGEISRSNVIPGIGAVLDQMSPSNLQGLMTAALPLGCTATAATSGVSSSKGDGGCVAALGFGLGRAAGTKRGREDGLRLPIVFREQEHERDGRVEGGWDLERERGPSKSTRLDGTVARGTDIGGHVGVGGGIPPGAWGYSVYTPSGLSGLAGADRALASAHNVRRCAAPIPPRYTLPTDRGYDVSGRPGPAGVCVDPRSKPGLGTMLQGRVLPRERMEWRHTPDGDFRHGPEGLSSLSHDMYTHEQRVHGRMGGFHRPWVHMLHGLGLANLMAYVSLHMEMAVGWYHRVVVVMDIEMPQSLGHME
uniref:PSF2m n=1 Tax=Volvox carteri f. nagariensis TaxID=3068 RepID=D9CJ52_VOLCA|nr:PSF2m [Volvox carteri f. nagariensis]